MIRGSIASESTFTGALDEDSFSQLSPEFLDIQTPLVEPTKIMFGSNLDCVIEWMASVFNSFASFHVAPPSVVLKNPPGLLPR